jgi:hypothetical protein
MKLNLLVKLIGYLDSFYKNIDNLIVVLNQENSLIKINNTSILNQMIKKKLKYSDLIQKDIYKIKYLWNEEYPYEKNFNISSMIDKFESKNKLHNSMMSDTLIILRQIQEKSKSLKLLICINKKIVLNYLEYYNKSYVFWQGVSNEVFSNYSEKKTLYKKNLCNNYLIQI